MSNLETNENGFEIEEDTFFLADTGEEKLVYQNRIDAITTMKDAIKNGKEAKVFVISTEGEQWSINQISWQDIAMELIKTD